MLTQTHLLLGAALFARRSNRAVTVAAVAGALVPDMDVWAMLVVEKAAGLSGCEIFHFRYRQHPWTTVQAVMNSIPLYALVLIAGLALTRLGRSRRGTEPRGRRPRLVFGGRRGGALGRWMAVFAASALLHTVVDLLVHRDDARRQFWPFSDWIFRSPVSYWDPDHFGGLFVPFEIGLGVGLAVLLWRRWTRPGARILLVLACLGYGLSVYGTLFGAAAHDRGPQSCDDRPSPYRRG